MCTACLELFFNTNSCDVSVYDRVNKRIRIVQLTVMNKNSALQLLNFTSIIELHKMFICETGIKVKYVLPAGNWFLIQTHVRFSCTIELISASELFNIQL